MFNLEFFHTLPFGQRVLWFFGISLAGWLLTKLILLIWEKLIVPIALKTETSLDDHLVKNTRKPVTRLMVLGGIFLAAQLTITSAHEVKSYLVTAENLLYLVLILFIASLANAIFKSFIDWYLQDIAPKTESLLDDTLFPMFRKAGTVIIYFIALTVILGQFKVNLTGFLATAGVASLAIAFAAQESLSNLIAGISILLDRSYFMGDRVELKDGLVGDVVEIGLRSTKIISLDQRLIIVPNKDIAGSRLINWSQPNLATKIKIKVGVALDENLERIKKIIMDTCAVEKTLAGTPTVLFTGYGPYFIEVLVVATVDDCRNAGVATDQMVMRIQEAFRKEKVRLPYPLQQVPMPPIS
jgi:MscS family membrane protein